MNMNFVANKIPVEITKEGAFGRTYFRDIYTGINGKWWQKQSWKEFDELKILTKNIIGQITMMLILINIKLNVEHH